MIRPFCSLRSDLKKFFLGGSERTVRTKKNILGMFVIRGLSQATGLVLVPLTLHYLNPTNYGLWLTLSSIIMWFNFFDIGLGNGLRNKLATALAKNDILLARTYISTTYVFLSIISAVLFFLYLLSIPFLNWGTILNAPPESVAEVNWVAFITFTTFCIRFVLGALSTILLAHQEAALNSFLDFGINIVSLLFIFLLTLFHRGSLVTFSIVMSMATILVPAGASFWFFHRRYQHLRPAFSLADKKQAKSLIDLGTRFFLLQISSVILFSTANILISQFFSPADVVPYNIAYKYYNILGMAFAIFLTPFWSAYTEAYIQHDIAWIRTTIKRLHQAWGVLAAFVVLFTFFANDFYRLWVGTSVFVPQPISIAMGFYILVSAWSSLYANIINGIGKIQLQVYVAVIISLLNIPLAYALAKHFDLGIVGIILAPAILLLLAAPLWPVQVHKILTDTGKGIWVQ